MRVIVADDAVLFREGLSRVLTEAGFDVSVGAGGTNSSTTLTSVTFHVTSIATV